MKIIKIALPLLLIVFLACQKESLNKRAIRYQMLLDNLVLDCPTDTSEYYFKATIDGTPTCYYAGVDSLQLLFKNVSIFTTPSPTFNTGDTISDARKGAHLSIRHIPLIQGYDYVYIHFPDYALGRDTLEYLDSLFNIEYHQVSTAKEERENFTIEFAMIDVSNGYVTLRNSMYSYFGPQDDSYVRFRKVKKTKEADGTYYYIEMEVECNLYHWAQYGYEGLWSKLEDGIFVAKFRATRRS